jgi:hypothetical protein
MQKLIKGPIDGYKAMNDDMTCRGFKFAIGKTYEMDNEFSVMQQRFPLLPSAVWCMGVLFIR